MTKRGFGATAELEITAAIEEARAAIGTPLQVESLRSKLAVGLVMAHDAQGLRASNGSSVVPTSTTISIAKATLLAAALGVVGTVAWFAKDATLGEPKLRAPDQASAPTIAEPTPAAARATPAPESGERLDAVPGGQLTRAPVPHGPERSAPPSATKHAARRASREVSSARATERSHPTEVELLTRAQALVDSQPSTALSVLREHELAYPSGLLREERDVLRIDAEWALGQRSAALAHARAFVQRYPRSAQTRRFETLLSDHKNEAEPKPTE